MKLFRLIPCGAELNYKCKARCAYMHCIYDIFPIKQTQKKAGIRSTRSQFKNTDRDKSQSVFFKAVTRNSFLLLFLEFFLTSGAAAVTKNINTRKIAVALVGYGCDGITEFFGFAHTLLAG